jgi:hypothetical protein
MAGPFESWNPMNHYVQNGLADGRFMAGGLTLLAAGPPRLQQLGARASTVGLEASTTGQSDIVYPIGITQNVNLQQNKQFMRVWELGSERSYWIGGRTTGNIALSRVFYDGASLLRILYAYYQDLVGDVQVPWMYPNIGANNMPNPHDVIVPPGYENLFINLASDMFNQPIGILVYMRNSNLDTVGAVYLEACVIPNHSFATDAQGTIVQESVGMQYERAVPVNVGGVNLVTGLVTAVGGIAAAA